MRRAMRRKFSPTVSHLPQRHDTEGSRSFSCSGVEEGPHRGGGGGWDRHNVVYTPQVACAAGTQRMSEMLQPRRVKDAGLQRVLQRPKMKNRRSPAHITDGVGAEGQSQSRKSTLSLRRDERIDDEDGYDARAERGGSERHGWEGHPPSVGAGAPLPQPLVDVRAAFGRMSNDVAYPRHSHDISAGNRATASLTPSPASSPRSHAAGAALQDSNRTRESTKSDWLEVATARATPPRVHTELPSTVASAQEFYRGWKTSPCNNEATLAGSAWGPVHGTDGFAAIHSTSPGAEAMGQYANPNAVAERILYALLQQNEDLAAVASQKSNTWNGNKGGMNRNSESGPAASFSSGVVAQPRPKLHVTPQEGRLLLGFLREKDHEILRLRTSLAMSYRFAAYAVHRQYARDVPGAYAGSVSAMEACGLGASASAVMCGKGDVPPWVNRAPPHIHGLPNVPLPLGFVHNVGQACGLLSMMNVENMVQKKMSARFFLGSWRTYFVVADDRGLTVYRSEEDYRQHAFQRALLLVPFRDMEYFVPSFRDVSAAGENLSDVAGVPGAAHARGWVTNSGGGLFFSPSHMERRPKEESTLTHGRIGAVEGRKGNAAHSSEAADLRKSNDRASLYMRRKQPGQYNQLMTRIAMEYAGDTEHAYFGFIPKQPSTQVCGKAVNPPILFRTQSTQEHVEWAHYFAQCFNRKLYREMFPTAVAEAYAGRVSKETQTAPDAAEPTSLESRAINGEGKKEEEKSRRPTVVSKEVMAVAHCVAAASQTAPCKQHDAATNTEEAQNGERAALTATPPPPPTIPPKRGVIGRDEVPEIVCEVVGKPQGPEVNMKGTATMVDVPAEEVGGDHVPWRELATELRGLLDIKNTERQEIQQKCEEFRLRVRQLNCDRDNLFKEVEEVHAMCDAETRRAQEAERNLQLAQEAARVAEAARQEAVMREGDQAARAKELEGELARMRHEQEILAAELLALKDGYSEGLCCLAKKALGDIDQLHDVYTAEGYLAALRGNDGSPPRTDDGSLYNESAEEATCHGSSSDHTLSPQRQQVQSPHVPPPATSLRQHPASSQQWKKRQQQRRPKSLHLASGISRVQKHSLATKAASNAGAAGGALGIAMLLISFMPRQLAIDGCFTVDESQARLLRSGPSATRRGREWVMLHHDTNAVFAVTAELQPDKEPRRTEPSKSPARAELLRCASPESTPSVCYGGSRPSRERLSRAVAGAKSVKRVAPSTEK
ncbi:hypothetical protein TRSC58_02426 [Trypanosoma rangeli SC58]|uniref:PH domain-containing protein n=1 Tax=Trypanosoma rangeli SC58 TaxID=429131 RepID=A0A061J4P6_TRYRA|nr:hypothetical protein TRSC58_02426 [Trypanosoma rangeli SC58]